MGGDVCPVWVGYILLSPFRRFLHNPGKIFGPFVRNGMTVLDIGCAMGFFSLPLARMVGQDGKVICIDVQERMIETLKKRARKAKVDEIIETHVCPPSTLNLEKLNNKIDFALAFAVIHEVPNPATLLSEIRTLLKTDGILLLVEPKGHVEENAFAETISIAESSGFKAINHLSIPRSRAVILKKHGEV